MCFFPSNSNTITTAQLANQLINECPEIDFDNLRLYAILIGDIRTEETTLTYSFSQQPDDSKRHVFSACWSGYIPKYKITKNKELALIAFEYPALSPEKIEPDEIYKLATADFWLLMRPNFFEDSVYIPFKNGKLIADQNEWFFIRRLSKVQKSIDSLLKLVKYFFSSTTEK